MRYVNNILGQHLIHHEFNQSFSTFMNEMVNAKNPDIRGIKTNSHLLKAEMFDVSKTKFSLTNFPLNNFLTP
jgi:hypothetical protein